MISIYARTLIIKCRLIWLIAKIMLKKEKQHVNLN